MTTESDHTIKHLAEILADQACELRELRATVAEQDDIIVEYELDQENQENTDAAMYADLKDLLGKSDGDGDVGLADILDRYFGDHE